MRLPQPRRGVSNCWKRNAKRKNTAKKKQKREEKMERVTRSKGRLRYNGAVKLLTCFHVERDRTDAAACLDKRKRQENSALAESGFRLEANQATCFLSNSLTIYSVGLMHYLRDAKPVHPQVRLSMQNRQDSPICPSR